MHKKFVKTQNVKNFITLANDLQNRAEGLSGLALVYGEPGLGKSKTALWWAMNNNAVIISAKKSMTTRWLLEELVTELGEIPSYKTSDLYNQVVKKVLITQPVIIVDEIDYLVSDKMAIEMLRDISDRTDCPVIMVGMHYADKKLSRFRHLYDRFCEILKFETFTYPDVQEIISQLSEVKISEDAVQFAFQNMNRMRQIVKLINKAETIAKANDLTEIGLQDLKKYILQIRRHIA